MRWSLILILLSLSSCQFYSKIETPHSDIDTSYLSNEKKGDYPIQDLFNRLNDPVLIELLEIGIKENLDLKIAVERVQEAKSKYGVKKSQLWPQIEFEAEWSRQKFSSQGIETVNLFGGNVAPNMQGPTSDLYFSAFDANWEIDLFQKIVSEKNAAYHEILSYEQMSRDFYISLQSEIATTYFQLRSAQQQLEILYRHQKARQETANLVADRYDAGLSTGLDLDRAQADLYDLQSAIPDQDYDLQQALNKLCFLLAKQPGELDSIIFNSDPTPPIDPGLFDLEIVSDVLRRRPDVRVAEQEYIRSQYLTRSAKADLFPRFSITGGFGFSSLAASDLFTHKNMLWTIGPAIRWPVFKGWELFSRIDMQKSIQKQASYKYYNTVFMALEEVENSLVMYTNQKKKDEFLVSSSFALTRAQDSTWDLYTAGLADFDAVLDVERRYLVAERTRISSYEMTLQALMLIYKSLGGYFE